MLLPAFLAREAGRVGIRLAVIIGPDPGADNVAFRVEHVLGVRPVRRFSHVLPPQPRLAGRKRVSGVVLVAVDGLVVQSGRDVVIDAG